MATKTLKPPNVLAVIPARGGSKRFHKKNVAWLLGRPMISYTIQAAREAEYVSTFVVSSEDPEILGIATEWGAETITRPVELSGDAVRNVEVVIHAVTTMEQKENAVYDIVVLLQPTSPIRDSVHIDLAIVELWRSSLSTAVSVKGPFEKRDPILKRIKDGVLEAYGKETGPFYLYNASIYAAKRNYLMAHRKMISDRQVPILMDAYHSIDVDTVEDFYIAEAILAQSYRF